MKSNKNSALNNNVKAIFNVIKETNKSDNRSALLFGLIGLISGGLIGGVVGLYLFGWSGLFIGMPVGAVVGGIGLMLLYLATGLLSEFF